MCHFVNWITAAKNPADRGTVAELSQHRDYDAPVPIYELSYLVYYYLEIML